MGTVGALSGCGVPWFMDERRRSIINRTGEVTVGLFVRIMLNLSQLIDFVVSTHPAYPKLLQEAKDTGKNTFQLLEERLESLQREGKAETLSGRLFLCLREKASSDIF
jgi:hypothetical protein